MAFTQTQLDQLDSAIAQGVLTVEYSDKKVTYRSFNEMMKTRALMLTDVNGGAKTKSKAMYPVFDRGL